VLGVQGEDRRGEEVGRRWEVSAPAEAEDPWAPEPPEPQVQCPGCKKLVDRAALDRSFELCRECVELLG